MPAQSSGTHVQAIRIAFGPQGRLSGNNQITFVFGVLYFLNVYFLC